MAGLERIAPVFPVSDLAVAMEHYRALGFQVAAYEDGGEYAFARRDRVEIHLALVPNVDATTTTSAAYLWVGDADALADQWRRVSGGRLIEPAPTDYGLREGAHLDPDGNLLRFGSPLVPPQ